MIYNKIEQLIGSTPLYNIERALKNIDTNAKLYAKLEYYNPFMSIKDRPAYNMIINAKEKGLIKEKTVIIEATSGNMGIALAGFGNLEGNKVIIVMPDNVTKERISLLKLLNAEIVLVDNKLGYLGCIEKAKELNKLYQDSYLVNQFENEYNYLAYQNYNKEIGIDIDCLIVASGSGGSLMGITKSLKKNNPNLYVIEVVAKDEKHIIAGITPRIEQKLIDPNLIDEVIEVSNIDATNAMKELIQFEGLMVGISSGANFFASKEVLKIFLKGFCPF